MTTPDAMLKEAATALALREKEAGDLRVANQALVADKTALVTKVATYAAQHEAVTNVLVGAGFDVGDKAAFIAGLSNNPTKLASVLKSALDHFSAAPSSGQGYIDGNAAEVPSSHFQSRWKV